tara:strand:- start:35 stop:211 length:177 start_codon:yes stop_codon:yes gene_type:complete
MPQIFSLTPALSKGEGVLESSLFVIEFFNFSFSNFTPSLFVREGGFASGEDGRVTFLS